MCILDNGSGVARILDSNEMTFTVDSGLWMINQLKIKYFCGKAKWNLVQPKPVQVLWLP